MRKLASIREISAIDPIQGADTIEVATVDGWKVVVKKGEFGIGDTAIYLEIDSWVPHELAPFLSKGSEPRVYGGVKGERLRTVKLRGQISQGLLLPAEILLNITGKEYLPGGYIKFPNQDEPIRLWEIGTDLTKILGIQKWEALIPAQMQGQAKGTFPTSLIPKTDQERIQNCFKKVSSRSDDYEVTLKLDGSSCTIFRFEGELRVCSRNMELKINEENIDNMFVRAATRVGIQVPEGFAFQGELMGPGIQGNRESLDRQKFFLFDIYDIKAGRYMTAEERNNALRYLKFDDNFGHVPVLRVKAPTPKSVEDALSYVDKIGSLNHNIPEGVVFKSNQDSDFSFKVISNRYLLKGGN